MNCPQINTGLQLGTIPKGLRSGLKLNRRTFTRFVSSLLSAVTILMISSCGGSHKAAVTSSPKDNAVQLNIDTAALLAAATKMLAIAPATVTATRASRSAGGPHDYYSEGRYWWPDPAHPEGPYIRRDGESNPDLFTAHHDALDDFSNLVAVSTLAFLVSNDARFSDQAVRHLMAWLVDTATRMKPNLEYGQAIQGINKGRGIGIIDTKNLILVAVSIQHLAHRDQLEVADYDGMRQWFDDYATWLTTSSHGREERDNGNNHSTWWGAQLAAFAKLAGREDLLDTARLQYRRQLALQMATNGSFPEELSRTRPAHYTQYNLDGFATFALLASGGKNDLWRYKSSHGSLRKAVDRQAKFYRHPATWRDTTALEPVIQPEAATFLALAAQGYDDPTYAALYRQLRDQHSQTSEAHLALLLWPTPVTN